MYFMCMDGGLFHLIRMLSVWSKNWEGSGLKHPKMSHADSLPRVILLNKLKGRLPY